MHVRSKKNRSGSISVVVVDKSSGRYKELHAVGVPKEESKIESFRQKGLEWIRRRKLAMQPELDLYGEERRILEYEVEMTERVVANIDNILINGAELILDRVFDRIGFFFFSDSLPQNKIFFTFAATYKPIKKKNE